MTKARLVELDSAFELGSSARAAKSELVDTLARSKKASFSALLGQLTRAELAGLCETHGLPAMGNKSALRERLMPGPSVRRTAEAPATDVQLELFGAASPPTETPPSVPDAEHIDASGTVPGVGELVCVRRRHYLVRAVTPPTKRAGVRGALAAHWVELSCVDDDDRDRSLAVAWELELDARRLDAGHAGLPELRAWSSHRAFDAYHNALRWQGVQAVADADHSLLQAPFRSAIVPLPHQIAALLRAMAQPFVRLLLADDVGLGKTIEAGLIVRELQLRQRVEFVLVACPSALCRQWQSELRERFALDFEIVDRKYFARMRSQRGFATNPWSCARRFIVSYNTLRRPEYLESLLACLGRRRSRSMLILDEAHNVVSKTARAVTQFAPTLVGRFEHRLFLSATPHGGHDEGLSRLRDSLVGDGVEAGSGATVLRRSTQDLIDVGVLTRPERRLVEVGIEHGAGRWRVGAQGAELLESPEVDAPELELETLLQEYRSLCPLKRAQDRRIFVGLQKRLLSSVAAFGHSFALHLASTGQRSQAEGLHGDSELALDSAEGAEEGEEEYDDALERRIAGGTGDVLPSGAGERTRIAAIVERMQVLLRGAELQPSGKFWALLLWMRGHLCPSIGAQWLAPGPEATLEWSERRVIVFTQYAHTAAYLRTLLAEALSGTADADQRIAYFHAHMSDGQRACLQADFNAAPDRHPLRILIATDAAREGLNLQGQCADLIHYDIPWCPEHIEQRHGRIDRQLQRAPELRFVYFRYAQREADNLLADLLRAVHGDSAEGSGGVEAPLPLTQVEALLERNGIDADTRAQIEQAGQNQRGAESRRRAELDGLRMQPAALEQDLAEAKACLERSRAHFALEGEQLRSTLEHALYLAGASNDGRMRSCPDEAGLGGPRYQMPDMPADWQPTLDSLRAPKPESADLAQWRRGSPAKSVVFHALSRIDQQSVHLHLDHPVVRRALPHILDTTMGETGIRAAICRVPAESRRVLLIARLRLYSRCATRLHDGLVYGVADLLDASGGQIGDLLEDVATERWVSELLGEASTEAGTPAPSELAGLQTAMAQLWPKLRARGEAAGQRWARQHALARQAIREAPDVNAKADRDEASNQADDDLTTLAAYFDVAHTRIDPVGALLLRPIED